MTPIFFIMDCPGNILLIECIVRIKHITNCRTVQYHIILLKYDFTTGSAQEQDLNIKNYFIRQQDIKLQIKICIQFVN